MDKALSDQQSAEHDSTSSVCSDLSLLVSTVTGSQFRFTQVTAFNYQHAIDLRLLIAAPDVVIGRRCGKDVELFVQCKELEQTLEEEGHAIRLYENRPSRICDRLALLVYVNLASEQESMTPLEAALIAGTDNGLLLIHRCPKDFDMTQCETWETATMNGVAYPLLGRIDDGVPTFFAQDPVLALYLKDEGTAIHYRYCDGSKDDAR